MFDSIISWMESGGYWGIFGLMLAENIFPPIPSEAIMPLAGFLAARGDLNFFLVVFAGTMGSYIGAIPWYYAGKFFGEERVRVVTRRFGRWLTISEDDVDKAKHWFHAHGKSAVFFGRLIPAIRTLISVPAGIARMPFWTFTFYTLLGSGLWTGFLTMAGYLLHANYDQVAVYLDPGSKVVVGIVVLVYLYRLVRQTLDERKQRNRG
ncbi:DedA family protein [Pseudomonas matsuisoli]|uniref:Alkaline phosphatase n=1 Tax=Pseudomonas matsuisoli TaxID=1515666 RepID=A0A917PXY9_9PSED|nr:DedA family protein [Pseudomonas matsuisoli]GGJ98439.1 alkaline phosphatase [Pseudomonas matsuisoli]